MEGAEDWSSGLVGSRCQNSLLGPVLPLSLEVIENGTPWAGVSPRVPGGNRPLMLPASLLGYPRTVPSMNFADQGGLAPFLYFLNQDCLVWGPACRVGAEEGVAGLDLHYI